jgi:RNA polymerase sigma-70 factor, ECF subfamily
MSKIDQIAFKKIFDKYFEPLCRYAYGYCNCTEQAKEIVQEVFMKIWEKREMLEISSANSYLYKAVKNKTLNHIRDHKKVAVLFQDPPEHVAEEIVEPPLLESTHIDTAIAELPKQCRTIFIMKRVQGLSYKEISKRLAVSEKTVENQMTIALKKLRESLTLIKNTLGEL